MWPEPNLKDFLTIVFLVLVIFVMPATCMMEQERTQDRNTVHSMPGD